MYLPNLFKNKPEAFDVSSVKYTKPIDEQLVNKLIGFLSKQGNHKIMVRITEEVNSLIAAALLKQVLKDNAVALIFDFGTTQTISLIEICKNLGLNPYVLKRGAAYQTEISAYRLRKQSDIRNFYQRFINYHLLIQVKIMGAAMLDIFDKSDRLLFDRPEGFYGEFVPFYSLYKSELYELAKYLNIPSQFIISTNYQNLSWNKIDPVLYLLTEKQATPEEISQQFNIDLYWLKKLKSHVDKQLFQTTVSQFII